MPASHTHRSPLSVLVVDDDAIERAQIRRLAAQTRVADIVEAATIDDALARLDADDCDVVLLDLLLGAEDGLDVVRRMRERNPSVPFVVLTGQEDPAMIGTAMRAGVIDFVAKRGLTSERLEQAIRYAARVGAAEREVAATRSALERQVSVLGALVELTARVHSTGSAAEALRTGVRAASVVFAARVTLELTHGESRLRAEHSPFPEEATPPLACRLAVPLTDDAGAHVGELLLERDAPPFDRVDELAAMQYARAVRGAVEKHALIAEARDRVREREEIVAVVSHDLRAPLETFAFGLDALRHAPPGPITADVLARMDRSTKQMTRLIDDLLDVSRIHDGNLSLRVGRVLVARLLAGVAEQLGPLATERRVTFVAEPPANGLSLIADEGRLQQAIGNLVTNAVRHAPSGHVVLRARNEPDSVLFEVTDDGPGVPAAVRGQLFDRLFQGEAGHRGALGLGLYIVRGIAEAHGGAAGMADAPGGGSAFWIRVPLKPSAA